MPISLFVASETATAAWGRVLSNETCSGIRLSKEFLVVGAVSHISFTACDDEDLPVTHGLPSATDGRRFAARQREKEIAVSYLGEGSYEVAVQTELYGTDVVQIELGGAATGSPLELVATCPSTGRTSALSTGAMSCPCMWAICVCVCVGVLQEPVVKCSLV